MLNIYDEDRLKKIKKGSLINSKGKKVLTVLALSLALSSCKNKAKQQPKMAISIENKLSDKGESWLKTRPNIENFGYLSVDLDLMVSQRLKIDDVVLSNSDCKELLGEMKDFTKNRDIYFFGLPVDNENYALLYKKKREQYQQALYISYDGYTYNDLSTIYIHYYDKPGIPLRLITDVEYCYEFDKDGNTFSKAKTIKYIDYDKIAYAETYENDNLVKQSIIYDENTNPFVVELSKNDNGACELVISSVFGGNYIPIEYGDYQELSYNMREYFNEDKLYLFISDMKDELRQKLMTVDKEYRNDIFDKNYDLINQKANKAIKLKEDKLKRKKLEIFRLASN